MRLWDFLPGVAWLIISTILLAIPGNDLPSVPFLKIPYFDKWVHFGMFLLLALFFGLPFSYSSLGRKKIKRWLVVVAISAIMFGVGMEYVQKYLVANRSFDVADIAFDAVGCIVGSWISWFWHKKIGPDRNRGRNQN